MSPPATAVSASRPHRQGSALSASPAAVSRVRAPKTRLDLPRPPAPGLTASQPHRQGRQRLRQARSRAFPALALYRHAKAASRFAEHPGSCLADCAMRRCGLRQRRRSYWSKSNLVRDSECRKRAESDRTPNGGNGRDSGHKRAVREGSVCARSRNCRPSRRAGSGREMRG